MSSPHGDRTRANPGVDPATGAPLPGSTQVPDSEAEVRARNESLGDMFSSFAEHLSNLFRKEIQLAKAEATDTAKKAGTGVGMCVGAGIGAFFLLMFLSVALMWALGSLVHLGWAALIVAGVWAIVTAVLAVIAKNRFDKMKALPQTQETLQEVPPTLNPSKETP